MKTSKPIVITVFAFIMFLSGCGKQELDSEGQLNESSLNRNQNSVNHTHTKRHSAEVATAWFNLLADITKNTPYNPPQTARIFAYSGMTLYESVVPGMPSYQSMYKHLTGNAISVSSNNSYYWPACANAALSRISSRLLANYPQNPNLTSIQELESNFNTSFRTAISEAQLQASIALGQQIADIIYDWSATDGTLNPNGSLAICPMYSPIGGDGNWVPVPPFFFPAAGACQGDLRTFVPNIVNTVFPMSPPAYSTSPGSLFYNMNEEIYQLSQNISPTDQINIQAWRDILGTNYNTPAHVIKLTSKFINNEAMNLEDASVLYAKQCIAMSDAIGASFYAKFDFSLLRPVTYIQNFIDSSWNSVYPTPQHPSYPAIATGAAGAAVAIWEAAFGQNYSFVDDTQTDLYGNWNYNSFDELLKNVGRSRTYSGLNYQISVDAAETQGRNVGMIVSALPFKK